MVSLLSVNHVLSFDILQGETCKILNFQLVHLPVINSLSWMSEHTGPMLLSSHAVPHELLTELVFNASNKLIQ